MKVFTATFISENYGSLLQAFALQSKLKELGTDPIIIALPKAQSCSRVRKFLRIIKYILRPEKHYGIIKKSRRVIEPLLFKGRKTKTDKFVSQYLKMEEYSRCIDQIDNENCILLAGSDQVWSTINAPISEFFLFDYVKALNCKRYSYAASIGVSELNEEQKLYYRKALQKFDTVSFREKVAYEMLKDYLENDIVRYDLDPTLLYDMSFWRRLTVDKKTNKPYIFVYMLRPDKKLIHMAKKIAKENHYQIIFVGQFNDVYLGVKTLFSAGVEDFLSGIYNAEMIVTNSFHCTVFSILFEKRFVSVKIDATNSRVDNLLKMTGLENRLIDDIKDLDVIYDEYDTKLVKEKIAAERNRSISYITSLVDGSSF